ncbi:MAG: ATP-dependent DNA helicase RecG [Chloroflexi bacterium]|nr:ATP-dependent DNA helicase RecG [Chloroflexota bacterium]
MSRPDGRPARTGTPAAPKAQAGRRSSKATTGKGRAVQPVLDWDTPIGASGLPGATAVTRGRERLGIRTVRDLVFQVPRRWIETGGPRSVRELRMLQPGTHVTARLQLRSIHVAPTRRRNLQRTIALLADEAGDSIEAIWFGRQFVERRVGPPGGWLLVSGKTGVDRSTGRTNLAGPEVEREDQVGERTTGDLLPVYRLTEGLTVRSLRRALWAALEQLGPYPEYLDAATRGDRMPIGEALRVIHGPRDRDELDRALDRLAFDELLALQVGMISRRRVREADQASVVRVDDATAASIVAGVEDALGRGLRARDPEAPVVHLTTDQAAAVAAVRADLASGRPMMRLVQGDVGSGKTAVAAAAMALVAATGGQSAMLAPTDLLARQHAATLGRLLEPLGHQVVLLTASISAAERREALEVAARPLQEGLLGGSRGLVFVGTQSLIGEAVAFADLRLAVVDEQHRFGVADRDALSAKGGAVHVLLMTATPIPQVLGQVLHADLDVTDLRAAPAGRLPVKTGIRRSGELGGTWERVGAEAAAGHRTFVVVPLIEPEGSEDGSGGSTDATGLVGTTPTTDDDRVQEPGEAAVDQATPGTRSAEEETERLSVLLAPLRVGMVHGRMKPTARDEVMAAFRDGALDVLVGTTVVEVGVDVPEATLMVIEGADRFGLAQLHQLRGRVGRGNVQSYCVLVADVPDDSLAMTRLRAVRDTTDGFALAELDIQLRGEGELLGLRQSGLPPLRVASLAVARHREMTHMARERAEALVDAGGRLRGEAFERELTGGWLARIGAGDVLREDEVDG